MIVLLIIASILVTFCQCFNSTKLVFTECNETISQRQFILQSPGYPNGYPGNISCRYFLKGNTMCRTEFHFQFLDFKLENSTNCLKDRLEVGNESLCGVLTGVRMFRTKNNYLVLNFVSDSFNERKGFKLLITKLPCEGNNHLNSSIKPKSGFIPKNNLPKCCADFYNSRRFYLSSPGFPYSHQIHTDCYYYIYRANPNICRLRIHFKYFSNGLQNGINCDYGFLEIDGRKICGCRTGLDVISQFDQFWGNEPKIIRYKNTGYSRNNFNGFVIEIIQDECPTRYSPPLKINTTNLKEEKAPEFYFYNDQLNRIYRSNIINTTNTVNKTNDKLSEKNIPKVSINYYFFKAPEFDDIPEEKYKEPRSYFETTSNDFLSSSGFDESKCYSWDMYQWTSLTKETLWQKMPECKIIQSLEPDCYEIKKYRGYILNPGYPFFYYSNLNCCYRFRKIEGYCAINVYVLDFDLETSMNCQNDAFILYDKYKYCGNELINSKFTFDLYHKEFEDIKFITNSWYCGRGFKIYYEHVPCDYSTTTPYVPPMTTPTSVTTPPLCGGDIISEYFDINFQNSQTTCNYNIYKADQEVCGLKLWFLNFDLLCGSQYLQINNEQYCGNRIGQSVVVDFDLYNKVTIIYRRRLDQTPVLSSIVLRGQQLRDCLDVPAQRILKP